MSQYKITNQTIPNQISEEYFLNWFLKHIPHEKKLIVALSGGKDSMCLLHLIGACRLKYRLQFELRALHVNHHLRGDESDQAEKLCRDYCSKYNILFARVIKKIKPGSNLQSRARQARLQAYSSATNESGGVILTAHHRNDRLETILMRLFRTGKIELLDGLKPISKLQYATDQEITLGKPLLPFSRKDVEAYVERKQIPSHEDSSNRGDNYLRNRVRHKLIPVLNSIKPDWENSLISTAEQTSGIKEFLQVGVENVFKSIAQTKSGLVLIPIERLFHKHFEYQKRIINHSVYHLGGDSELSSQRIKQLSEVINNESYNGCRLIFQLDSLSVWREWSSLVFTTDETRAIQEYVYHKQKMEPPRSSRIIADARKNLIYVNMNSCDICVGNADYNGLLAIGKNKSKLVSTVWKENKVPKRLQPFMQSVTGKDQEIIAIEIADSLGNRQWRVSDKYMIQPESKFCYRIQLQPREDNF